MIKLDSPINKRRIVWLICVLILLAFLVVVWPLHEGTRISSGAQRRLYDQTVDLIQAQQRYAIAHQGQYASSAPDLATADPALAYALGDNSPVIQFATDGSSHGFYTELADQSTGGAASFSVILPDEQPAQLTCVGPAPLCNNGKFKFPPRLAKSLAAAQRDLYDQTVALIAAEQRYAALNNSYASATVDLATIDPAVAYAARSSTPISTLTTDASNHGYYMELSGLSESGEATFSVLVPDHGPAVLTCTGSPPLCSHGTFKLIKRLSSRA